MTEAVHNAGVEREILAVVADLFSEHRTPTQQERDATQKRLRRLLFGNKQLNPAERMGLEGRIWQRFAHDSAARAYLDDIGFLHWN